jgi:hypothetical protein
MSFGPTMTGKTMNPSLARRARTLFAAVLLCTPIFAVAACGDDSGGGPGPAGNNVNHEKVDGQITRGGGTVAIDGASLRAPAEAVATPIIIEITALDPPPVAAPEGTSFVSFAYAFTPHRTTFDIAATLRISYDPEATEGLRLAKLDDDQDQEWEFVTGMFSRGEAVTTTNTLSIYAVVADGPVVCGSQNACGGCEALPNNPGDSCGDCQVYRCDGEEAVACRSTNECGAGEIRCADNQVQGCQDVGGCLIWATTEDCNLTPNAQCNADGTCHVGCTNECDALDATACVGTVPATCAQGPGECLVLEPGALDCATTGQACDATTPPAACVCPASECTLGELRCSVALTEVQECQDLGGPCREWATATACAADEICTAGAPPSCECFDPCPAAGDTACDGSTLQICAVPSGLTCLAWTLQQDCAATSLTCDATSGTAVCQ